MSSRLLKFRPLQLCILAGLIVYVVLTVIDNALFLTKSPSNSVHRDQRVDPQSAGRTRKLDEETKPDTGPKSEDISSGERLKKIEFLLGKIHQRLSEEGQKANVSDIVHDDIKTVKDLFRQAYGSENLVQIGESDKFYMNGFLQEPKESWPKPPKVQLNEKEYMKDPAYVTTVSICLLRLIAFTSVH